MSNTVLVVEDDPNILRALEYNLKQNGYATLTATDGESGFHLARTHRPDMLILDVMLPNQDGFELCRMIRRESDVPILMLTAKVDETDRVQGLAIGADDYVTKPFSMPELMLRVRNMLRRYTENRVVGKENASEIVRSGNLTIDLVSYSATLDGEPLVMKPREFSLIALLASSPRRAFTRDQILERLWGQDYIGDSRTVDVHIRWLREKIEPDPSKPVRIVTIRGVGYRFDG